MLGHTWYNEQIKRYVAVFGTMFNDIIVNKYDSDGTLAKQVRVPITFGPKERFLVRRTEDPNLDRPYSLSVPAISFEMNGMIYDAPRKLGTTQRFYAPSGTDKNKFTSLWQPVPYDINFQLNIITRSYDDACQIVEQILPFFTPEWTNEVILVEDPYIAMDVPIVLVGVSNTDMYEGDFKERRNVLWTLDFVMKAWFFGPTTNKQVIKVAKVDMFADGQPKVNIKITPGLTANGEPTTDPTKTIHYQDVEADDNWDYIVEVKEKE